MSDAGKPTEIWTDFHPAPQLTAAVTRKEDIQFDITCHGRQGREVYSALQAAFARSILPLNDSMYPNEEGISISPVYQKIEVFYKPEKGRNLDEAMMSMVTAFTEAGVPMNDSVLKGVQHAFDALKQLNRHERGGAVAAEAARRSAKKDPGVRRPR